MIERVYRTFQSRVSRDRAAADLQAAGFDVETFGMAAFCGSGATYEVSGRKDIDAEDFPTCAYSHGYTEEGDRLDSPGLAAYVEDQLAAG